MNRKRLFRELASLGLAGALFAPVLPARASAAPQTPQTAERKGMHDALQEAVNELNLNDDQKGKLKDIFADARAKREAIWKNTSLSDDEKKDKMKALHEDTKAKVSEVLTPDQRDQLKAKMEAAMKAKQQPQ